MSKQTYTVSNVIATMEGSWVSADVYAVISGVKPPRGKGPWTATLSDSTGQIVGKFWGGDISHWEGKRVKLSGQGMQRKAYNGTPELSVGQKADISFAGAPGTAAQNDDVPYEQPPARPQTRPAPQSPSTAQGNPVHGATAGGCLARAVDIWIATKPPDSRWTESSATIVEQIARQLAAIHVALETGAPPENVPF